MEALLALAAVTLLIALGTLLIHRLGTQRDARIAAHRFSAPFPPISRPPDYDRHGPGGQAPGSP